MSRGFRIMAGAVAALVVSAAAPAQQPHEQWTIEALTAQARVVFRGSVTDILRLGAQSKPGGPPRVSLMLTIHVAERIKGNSDSWMTLIREADASDGRYDAWMKAKASMLWFRFSEEDPRPFPDSQIGPGLPLQPGQSWTAIHLSDPDPAELAADPSAGQGIFAMDLTVLKNSQEKLAAANRFVKAAPDPVKVCRVLVPASVTGAVGETHGTQYLVLPVTPELEPLALRMVTAPETFLPKSALPADAVCIRAAGVRALANFQSDKNVSLLKSLLADPSKGPTPVTEGPVKTRFWVRLAAYDALTGWSVKVAKPVLHD